METKMDPDDPLAALRGQAQDAIADNALQLGQALPGAEADPNPADCEFDFVGGAGTGGPYLESLRKSFEKAGIQHVNVPNQGNRVGNPLRDAPLYRIAPDVA